MGSVEAEECGSNPGDPDSLRLEEGNPMYTVPDVDEVVAVAKGLGIRVQMRPSCTGST